MTAPTLTREDWEYIHSTLMLRVRRQSGKLRNAKKKGFDSPQTQYLEQDTKRAEALAARVKP